MGLPINKLKEWNYFIELKNNKTMQIDQWSFNKLFANLGENENICFEELMKNGTRIVCVPGRNINYFYKLEIDHQN